MPFKSLTENKPRPIGIFENCGKCMPSTRKIIPPEFSIANREHFKASPFPMILCTNYPYSYCHFYVIDAYYHVTASVGSWFERSM